MTIVERLWTEQEHFDHDGEFFKVVDGESLPKPVQDPYPLVMNAGSSGPGVEFAAKHANVIFINPQGDHDSIRASVESIKAEATKDGKEVGVWAVVHVVAADTEAEAQEYVHFYAQEKGDLVAAGRYADALTGADSTATKALADRHPKELIDLLLTGGGPRPLIGSDQQVVDGLKDLSDAGLDGLAFSFVDFEAGIERYQQKLLPLMREVGLRVE
jgi:alkanesulfonate monooxygenase SsuD/methylene tetrahydromethanopterin reductase-like flavin-dependent oxidoreductase (luciferase family)